MSNTVSNTAEFVAFFDDHELLPDPKCYKVARRLFDTLEKVNPCRVAIADDGHIVLSWSKKKQRMIIHIYHNSISCIARTRDDDALCEDDMMSFTEWMLERLYQ